MIIMLPFAAPFVVAILLRAPEPETGVNRAQQVVDAVGWLLPAVIIVGNLGFLVAGWWFRRRRPVDGWERRGAERLLLWQALPIGVGVGITGIVVGGVVTAASLAALGLEPPQDEAMRALAGSTGTILVGFMLLGILIAPLGEELFFRGHLLRWAASRCGFAYANLLAATIFAVGHLNPLGIPFYFTTGLILGWSYERWRTLAVPIMAHATINAVVISGIVVQIARG